MTETSPPRVYSGLIAEAIKLAIDPINDREATNG